MLGVRRGWSLVSRWVTPVAVAEALRHLVLRDAGPAMRRSRWTAARSTTIAGSRPATSLAAQRAGEIDLPPPTFVTITRLAAHGRVHDALASFAREPAETFEPKLCPVEGGAVTLYAGDAGYDRDALDCPGPRHRLWMLGAGWRYERE